MEDLLSDTLVTMAQSNLGWEIADVATKQGRHPIVDILAAEIAAFSRYRLARVYLGWTHYDSTANLAESKRNSWTELINRMNRALR